MSEFEEGDYIEEIIQEDEIEGGEEEPEEAEESEDQPVVEEDIVEQIPEAKNEYILVKKNERRCRNVLSKYEMTEIVSIRAKQIAEYKKCYVDVTGLTDPIMMAKRELMERKTPLLCYRAVGRRFDPKTKKYVLYVEAWDPKEMEFTVSY